MNAGVSIVPRGSVIRPRRAEPSVASSSNRMISFRDSGLGTRNSELGIRDSGKRNNPSSFRSGLRLHRRSNPESSFGVFFKEALHESIRDLPEHADQPRLERGGTPKVAFAKRR